MKKRKKIFTSIYYIITPIVNKRKQQKRERKKNLSKVQNPFLRITI